MKITSVELQQPDTTNPLTSLVFSFRDPRRLNPYTVVDISGLGVEDVRHVFYEYAPQVSVPNSYKYYRPVLGDREVIITCAMKPSYAAGGKVFGDLRDAVYKFIASNRYGAVNLLFKNGATEIARMSGFIRKVEPGIFAKNPTVQITFIPQTPFLRAPSRTIYDVSKFTHYNFLYPEDYDSTAPHGFVATFGFTQDKNSMLLTDPIEVGNGWKFQVFFGTTLTTGDVIYFSSEEDNKYLYAIKQPGNLKIELMDKIEPRSVWPIMFPGRTSIGFAAPSEVGWSITSWSFYKTYWGI